MPDNEEETKIPSTDQGAIKEEDVSETTTDGNESDDGDLEPKPKKQSKEDNARYAKARREAEAKAASKNKGEAYDKAYQEGYRKAQMDATDKNPYTGEPILTDEDLSVYLEMKELDNQGKDPVKSYPSYVAKKLADKKSKEAEEAKRQKEIADDIAKQRKELETAHPEISISDLYRDKDFKEYCDKRVGRWTYLEIVDGWLATHGNAKQEAPKKRGTPSFTQTESHSKKGVYEMSDEDFETYMKKKYGGF